MIARLIPVALAALFTTSVASASELPPYAGSHDDASYGDVSRSTFDVELIRPDGVTVVGSRYDDTTYGTPEEGTSAPSRRETRIAERTACTCRA